MILSLQFNLDIEDDWPPVSIESLPFEKMDDGYKCLEAPLFVKDLSVGDVISVEEDGINGVKSWVHLQKSGRTTIWILRISETDEIDTALKQLRLLDCNTVGLPQFGCYAVDVPQEVSISDVDSVLEKMSSDRVVIAFPSMRHPD
jgi:hypothetical protein